VRVALLQFAAGLDKADNLEQLGRLARDAARTGPDLVICPEAVLSDFGPPEHSLASIAEPVDGPFANAIGRLARELRTTIVVGMFEPHESESKRAYNTLVALGPDGGLLASYRKVHLYDAFGFRESDKLAAGDPGAKPAVFDLGGFRVGLLTCYDLRFPEVGRVLADAGADVLAVPAAWVRGPLKEEHWSTLLRARAIENTCYVAAAAQCAPTYCGRSELIDPFGTTVAGLGEQVGFCTGDVRPERISEVRKVNPALTLRRYTVVPKPTTDTP
jgi:predicted amidohydrolase